MPLYEYKCSECGQIFELIQRFSDAPLTQHEGCGGAVVRLISAPALQFKGTGWYITDYAKGSGGGSGKNGGKSGSQSESKSDAKSDSKSESKSSDSSSSSSSSKSDSASASSSDKK